MLSHLEELRRAMADEIEATRPDLAAAIRAADAPKPPRVVRHLRVIK